MAKAEGSSYIQLLKIIHPQGALLPMSQARPTVSGTTHMATQPAIRLTHLLRPHPIPPNECSGLTVTVMFTDGHGEDSKRGGVQWNRVKIASIASRLMLPEDALAVVQCFNPQTPRWFSTASLRVKRSSNKSRPLEGLARLKARSLNRLP